MFGGIHPQTAQEDFTGKMHIARKTLGTALVFATVAVVLLYAVLPLGSFFDQRAALAEDRQALEDLEISNEQIVQQIDDLQTREQIEILARRDFNLVYPGQEAYAILPAPPPAVSLPSAWPFWRVAEALED